MHYGARSRRFSAETAACGPSTMRKSDLYPQECGMLQRLATVGVALVWLTAAATAASAQALEKKHFNYSEWTKGRFSEAVTVTGPGKMIFLAGGRAEDENGKGGDLPHKGDFTGQCQYAHEKIKRVPDKQGATPADPATTVP